MAGGAKRDPTHHSPLTTHTRRGTSLSEVLISTLVMSIGVVALASLFPISVLRSIQASQLTNAANLRYNAEAQMKTNPQMVTIGDEWQAAFGYQPGDVVAPLQTTRLAAPVAAVFACTTGGTSTAAEPPWNWREGASTTDGTVTWLTVQTQKYVIDPLGYLTVDPADPVKDFRGAQVSSATDGAQQHFGNVQGKPFFEKVNRFPAFGLYKGSDPAPLNEYRATAACVLPDSWALQAESLDLNYVAGNTSIDLNGVDANNLAQAVQFASPDLVPDRLVLMDESNRRSHMRVPTGITGVAGGAQITWAAGQALPAGFTPVRARVESLERRYSYILSIRRGPSGAAYTDVVVFFRRSFGVQDEQVYSCVFRKIDRGTDGAPGVAGVDDNPPPPPATGRVDDITELGWQGSDDKTRNFVILQYNSATEKPFFKKGGFICDPHSLRWYRIIDTYEPLLPGIAAATPAGFELDPVATGADRFVRLTLDKAVLENSPMTPTLTPLETQNARLVAAGTGGVIGGAILIRGVVDVYPLRARMSWEE